METITLEYSFSIDYQHQVFFSQAIFDPHNTILSSLLTNYNTQGTPKVLLVIDDQVIQKNPLLKSTIHQYFRSLSQKIAYCGLLEYPGGETLKNDLTHLKNLYKKIEEKKLCRHSFLIAVGGGALLDMVGFVATTAHRGILHIRIPTTSLSQGDGGVGVKNGINFLGKKNFIGGFSTPVAVINDSQFLETLTYPQLREGFIEALKVAIIRDAKFFQEIQNRVPALLRRDPPSIHWLIKKSAQHHIEHITKSADPFEKKSSRPLDFGHWIAHRLETLSSFVITHGQAVAIGMAVDVLYSSLIGYLPKADTKAILALITQLGFDTYHPKLIQKNRSGHYDILTGLEEFREHLGGTLSICLLREIGNPIEVDHMDQNLILQAIQSLKEPLNKWS